MYVPLTSPRCLLTKTFPSGSDYDPNAVLDAGCPRPPDISCPEPDSRHRLISILRNLNYFGKIVSPVESCVHS